MDDNNTKGWREHMNVYTCIVLTPHIKKYKTVQDVAHTVNPSTWEADTDGFL